MMPDYCLTKFVLNFGCYHLERLELLRGDQVAFLPVGESKWPQIWTFGRITENCGQENKI